MTSTLSATLSEAARRLQQAGIDEARREARLLLEYVLELRPEAIIANPDRVVAASERERLAALVERRARREPLSHILGWREFWSLPFRVSADVLDPRPDSETLVQAALDEIADRTVAHRVLDLGTGTGCLLLALLSELPRASGVGVDCSPAAIELARTNADALGLAGRARFVLGDWDEGLDEDFNLIVTNPPYIPLRDICCLAPEVALYEPRLALTGGDDGLDCYRALAPGSRRLLAAGGRLIVEVGQGQADRAEVILAGAGLRPLRRARDLGGVERCLILAPT